MFLGIDKATNTEIVQEKPATSDYPSPVSKRTRDRTIVVDDDVPASTTGGRKKRSSTSTSKSYHCGSCGQLYSDKSGKREVWVGCSHIRCDFWAHSKCFGFSCKSEEQLQGIKFYCPQHRSLH